MAQWFIGSRYSTVLYVVTFSNNNINNTFIIIIIIIIISIENCIIVFFDLPTILTERQTYGMGVTPNLGTACTLHCQFWIVFFHFLLLHQELVFIS